MTGSGPPHRGACPGPDPRGQAERRAFAFEVVSPGVLEGVVVPYGVPIRIGGAPGAGRAGVGRGLGAPIWALSVLFRPLPESPSSAEWLWRFNVVGRCSPGYVHNVFHAPVKLYASMRPGRCSPGCDRILVLAGQSNFASMGPGRCSPGCSRPAIPCRTRAGGPVFKRSRFRPPSRAAVPAGRTLERPPDPCAATLSSRSGVFDAAGPLDSRRRAWKGGSTVANSDAGRDRPRQCNTP